MTDFETTRAAKDSSFRPGPKTGRIIKIPFLENLEKAREILGPVANTPVTYSFTHGVVTDDGMFIPGTITNLKKRSDTLARFIARHITRPIRRGPKEGDLIIAGNLKDYRPGRNDGKDGAINRYDENIGEVQWVWGDYDAGEVTLEKIDAHLGAKGIVYFAYQTATSGYRKEKNEDGSTVRVPDASIQKWRVLIPANRPVPIDGDDKLDKDTYAYLVRELLSPIGKLDEACVKIGQPCFLPSAAKDDVYDGDRIIEVRGGQLFDLASEMERVRPFVMAANPRHKEPPKSKAQRGHVPGDPPERLISECKRFLRKFRHRFSAPKFLAEIAWPMSDGNNIVSDAGKVSGIRCPYAHHHSEDAADDATWATDSTTKGATTHIDCRHSHCHGWTLAEHLAAVLHQHGIRDEHAELRKLTSDDLALGIVGEWSVGEPAHPSEVKDALAALQKRKPQKKKKGTLNNISNTEIERVLTMLEAADVSGAFDLEVRTALYGLSGLTKANFAKLERAAKKEQKRAKSNPRTAAEEQDEPLNTQGGAKRLPFGFFRKDAKFYKIEKEGEPPKPVSDVFDVVAYTHAGDSDWHRLIRFTAPNGTVQDVTLAQADINADAKSLAAKLGVAGLTVDAPGHLQTLLRQWAPDRIIEHVEQPGFHNVNGKTVFVLPTGVVIGGDNDDVKLLSEGRIKDVSVKGTLDEWRDEVAIPVMALEVPHWHYTMSSGANGTIIQLLGDSTRGVNLSGASSRGKSIAQFLGAGMWASPKHQDGVCFTARATDNGCEALMAKCHGTFAALDEPRHMDPSKLGQLIFMVAEGSGKQRLKSDSSARKTRTWQTFYVTSLEQGIKTAMLGGREHMRAGQSVRLANINVGEVAPIDPAVAKHIEDTTRKFYGTAGPAFVEWLFSAGHVADGGLRIRGMIEAAERELLGTDNKPALARVARTFAYSLVGGRLMIEAGVLPPGFPVDESVKWAWESFKASPEAQLLDPASDDVERVLDWAVTNYRLHVADMGAQAHRETLAWYSEDKGVLYMPVSTFENGKLGIINGGHRELAKALDERGLLVRRRDGRLAHQDLPGGGGRGSERVRKPHYRIKTKLQPTEQPTLWSGCEEGEEGE